MQPTTWQDNHSLQAGEAWKWFSLFPRIKEHPFQSREIQQDLSFALWKRQTRLCQHKILHKKPFRYLAFRLRPSRETQDNLIQYVKLVHGIYNNTFLSSICSGWPDGKNVVCFSLSLSTNIKGKVPKQLKATVKPLSLHTNLGCHGVSSPGEFNYLWRDTRIQAIYGIVRAQHSHRMP